MRLTLYLALAAVLAIASIVMFSDTTRMEDLRTPDLAFVIELNPDRAPNSYLLPGEWFTPSRVLGLVGTPVYVDILTKYDFHEPELDFALSSLDLSGHDSLFIICLPEGFYAISDSGFEDCQPYSPEKSELIITDGNFSFELHAQQIWGDWEHHIYNSTDNVRHVVEEIEKEAAGDDAHYIRAAYEWVQGNLNYTNEIDYQTPVPAIAEILDHRTTDCKGYSALLATLLKARRIESQLVLVRTQEESTVTSDYLLDGYDHTVLYLPDYDAYLDPTVPSSRPEELYVSRHRTTGFNLTLGVTVDLPEQR
ncbi:transglutaminase domain-containing protein [Natronospirillum operosum]|uniref:Transglutaminase domain-containing protein n=1 Tax=Natronospirillum operosum TaxID=2759953 RepID=A0A4Z0W2U3_9GAMM|nr:transglutaminase domain-containing protein [Natronospirillum operosum]TGG89373.1 transglutaminase domain-containing protein [Natronospirillum operosum]